VNCADRRPRVGGAGDNVPVARPTTTVPRRGAGRARPEAGPPTRVAALIGLSVVVVVAAALAGPWDPPTRGESLLPWTPPVPDMPTVPPAAPIELQLRDADYLNPEPWDLTWLGIVLLSVIVLWVVFLVARWLQRHPVELPPDAPDDAGLAAGDVLSGPGVRMPDLPALREAVAGADLLVRRHVPPTDAVIAAWVHLEQAAARSGVPRDRAQTPTEFTVAVLDRTPVDPAATRALLNLYLRARFGGERMTTSDVTAAVAALTVLAEGLGDPDAAALDEIEVVPDDEPGGPGEAP